MGRYVLKSIRFELSDTSIGHAISEIEKFERDLKPAMQSLIEKLAEYGVDVAKATLMMYDEPAYMTGQLQESIQARIDEGRAVITAGEGCLDSYGEKSYAVYVEYGTGFFAEGAPSSKPHGWYYAAPWPDPTDPEGRPMIVWTYGMPARPFMGDTFVNIEEKAKEIGAEVIAQYFR